MDTYVSKNRYNKPNPFHCNETGWGDAHRWTLVARRYAMNANLIFKWLKDPRFQSDKLETEESTFLPVEISLEPEAALPTQSQSMPVRDAYSRSGPSY
jgi:hypothetical protein